MKAILIKNVVVGRFEGTPIVQEQITEIKPAKGKEFSLQELYDHIGCTTVEHLGLVQGVHLWVDENGRLTDRPLVNQTATKYFRKAFPPGQYEFPGGVTDIVGNAIIVDNTKNGWL